MIEAAPSSGPTATPKGVPKRKPLPVHLPRQETVLSPGDACRACGGKLKPLGEDVTEELDYVPGRFVVNRIVRPRRDVVRQADGEHPGHSQRVRYVYGAAGVGASDAARPEPGAATKEQGAGVRISARRARGRRPPRAGLLGGAGAPLTPG